MKTCNDCNQECCKSVIVEVDKPETWEDWEYVKWQVAHKNVSVLLDNEGDWCIEFLTPCEEMHPDGRCKIYHKRPKICRTHDPETCVTNGEGDYYKLSFNSVEEVEKYLEEHPEAIGEEMVDVNNCPKCGHEWSDDDEDEDDEDSEEIRDQLLQESSPDD